MPAFFDKLMRAGEGRILRELSKIVVVVNGHESRISAMSDSELRAQTEIFKERFSKGESLDDLMPEAFAVVREAARELWASVTTTFRLWVEPHFIKAISRKCELVKERL